MNRIQQLFEQKKNNILSVYFTAGYPNLNDTADVIRSLVHHGVDMIEIGVPFSDPLADGPVIQASSQKALQNGMSVSRLFEQLKDIRSEISVPLVLMGYYNPILAYGIDNYCKDAAKVGIDGFIIPDLPLSEYKKEMKSAVEQYGLSNILLITPETSEERVREIDANTSGFIYMVSSASTTGARDSFGEEQRSYFNRIANMKLNNPTLVGFGISNAKTYADACQFSSGGIIGSAFVSLLGSSKTADEAAFSLVQRLRK